MPKVKSTTRRQNLQQIGNQLASLIENPDTPHHVEDGIKEMLCEIASVVPVWTPAILRAIYPILVEEAEKLGVDLQQPNYIGQEIEAAKSPRVM